MTLDEETQLRERVAHLALENQRLQEMVLARQARIETARAGMRREYEALTHDGTLVDTAQPMPSGGAGDVWAEVISRLPEWRLSRMAVACRKRSDVGQQVYGVPLGRGDGRNDLRDLAEELLDAAVYAARMHKWELCKMLISEADRLGWRG